MSSVVGAVRRLVLAPSLASVTFAGRAFPVAPSARTEHLEAVPRAVVCGFEWGIDSSAGPRGLWELQRRLDLVEPSQRGFAYEGAAMAAVVLDAMGGFRGTRTHDLLSGPGRPHVFLTFIGVGFAMARLPRPLWRKVLPDLPGVPHHRTMSWLAVDGYAFDLAFFDPRPWITDGRVPAPYPWQGRPDYFSRAADQGIGRALWFVHGAEVGEVAAAVARFDPGRHADLWSGVGLAASVAGGADERGLARLRGAAGAHWRQLGLGAVFAAVARTAAGYVPDHTEVATLALADLAVDAAVALADRTAPDPHGADDAAAEPAYETWRGAIRAELPGTAAAAAAA